jgi:hypothetical protein
MGIARLCNALRGLCDDKHKRVDHGIRQNLHTPDALIKRAIAEFDEKTLNEIG